MENLPNVRTLEKDPQYFGAFLNMARHNVFTINNHLVEKINKKFKKKDELAFLEDEEKIGNSFLINEIKNNSEKIYKQVKRFITFVRIYDLNLLSVKDKKKGENIDYKMLAEDINICFSELNKFRNDYTHFYSQENGIIRKIIADEKLVNFLKKSYKQALEYTKERFKKVLNDSDFNSVGQRKIVEENNILNQNGFVFFTCLFLDRENAFRFMSKIEGFKDTRMPKDIATREVYTAFCAKLPHDKFISEDNKQALTLDILNYLSRCPEELNRHINIKGKEAFQSSENENESIPDDSSKIRKKDGFPRFALKYLDCDDKFKIYFHIDLCNAMLNKDTRYEKYEKIRVFGKTKSLIEKENIQREIDKRGMATFEPFYWDFHIRKNKIGFSFAQAISEIKLKKNKKDEMMQYLFLPNPNGFISINELPKVVLLEILKEGEVEKIIRNFFVINKEKIFNEKVIEEIKNKVKSMESISLNKKDGLNKILNEYDLNERQIPQKILNYWFDIKVDDEIKSIINKIEFIRKDCELRIKELTNYNKIIKLSSEKKEESIKRSKIPQPGEMADFLAHDIVNMIISEEIKNKVSTNIFEKMKECLALFNVQEKRDEFWGICEKNISIKENGKIINIYNKEKGHPFLYKINKKEINKTKDFYEKYLRKKGDINNSAYSNNNSWLYDNFYIKIKNPGTEENEYKININKNNISKLPYSIYKPHKKKWTFDEWLKNVKDGCEEKDNPKPVDLPTNIFDDTLIEILRTKLEEKGIQYEHNYKFSKLLGLYCNDTQPFYNAEREYKFFRKSIKIKLESKNKFTDYFENIKDEVINKIINGRKKKNTKEININEKKEIEIEVLRKFNNAITENEKTIRYYQNKDRISLEMVKKHIESDKSIDIDLQDLKLCNISSKLLDKTVNLKHTINGKLSYDENGEYIKNKNMREDKSKIISGKRKIKDFSVFKKFVFDRRLPELFQYFDDEEIDYNILENELIEYNKYKEYVFDRVFELEKDIMKKPNALPELEKIIEELIEEEKKKNPTKNINVKSITHIQHKPYLVWLIKKNKIDENLKSFLEVIRNSFSHNQFPPKVIIEKFVNVSGNGSFSQKIYEKYEIEIKKIVAEVKKS